MVDPDELEAARRSAELRGQLAPEQDAPVLSLEGVVREAAAKFGVVVATTDPNERLMCFSGCGATVNVRHQDCHDCDAKRQRRERNVHLRRAWETVPASLRWVDMRSELVAAKLDSWVRDGGALARAGELAASLPAHPRITLTGKAGAGKTTLACALLREWMRPGSRRSSSAAEYGFARRARFAVASDLVMDRTEARLGEHIPSIDLARNASVLVLDEVGRGKDPHGIVFDLLHRRHRDGRPTIVTTPSMSVEELAEACADGGLARRVFEDAEVVKVERLK